MMQIAMLILSGLVVIIAIYIFALKYFSIAKWIALFLGFSGIILLFGSIGGYFLTNIGRFGAIGIGVILGIATVLSIGCLVQNKRRLFNWIAVIISTPPLIFLIVFGLGELLSHSD